MTIHPKTNWLELKEKLLTMASHAEGGVNKAIKASLNVTTNWRGGSWPMT